MNPGGKTIQECLSHRAGRDQLKAQNVKSLGNSPEPLDLIEKYGADGVRVGMMLCSPAGNDLLL